MISSRDVAMPTNRAYGTCYTILTNYMALIRSSYYGPPCSCRQTRWFSLTCIIYPNVDMQALQPPTVVRADIQRPLRGPIRTLDAPPRSRARGFGRDTFVAGSSSNLEYRHAYAWPIRY